MKLTKNFNREEFDCRNGAIVPNELMENLIDLAEQLQILREYLDEPIHVNSGYRTPEYNKSIGGAKNSYHCKAMAADITTKNKSPKQLKAIVEKLISKGILKFKGIGLYPGFIHVDIRKTYSRW